MLIDDIVSSSKRRGGIDTSSGVLVTGGLDFSNVFLIILVYFSLRLCFTVPLLGVPSSFKVRSFVRSLIF